jgi:hypothetical protein
VEKFEKLIIFKYNIMSSELSIYKQNRIKELQNIYNSNVSRLYSALNVNISNVNKSRNNKSVKEKQINKLVNQYKYNVNVLQTILNQNIKNIRNFVRSMYDRTRVRTKKYFVAYKKQYNPVFQQYTTSKKRVYGGQANSYGRPTRYDGIVIETIGQVNLKSKSRAEVYFKTDSNVKAEYLFILLKESDSWKINNVKYKWFNNDKWKSLIM